MSVVEVAAWLFVLWVLWRALGFVLDFRAFVIEQRAQRRREQRLPPASSSFYSWNRTRGDGEARRR